MVGQPTDRCLESEVGDLARFDPPLAHVVATCAKTCEGLAAPCNPSTLLISAVTCSSILALALVPKGLNAAQAYDAEGVLLVSQQEVVPDIEW